MAVRAACARGWVLDHEAGVNAGYTTVHSPSHPEPREFQCLPELFEIWEPFRYDSQYEKLQHERGHRGCESVELAAPHGGAVDVDVSKDLKDPASVRSRKRKKKRKTELNQGELAALEFHEKVQEILKTAQDQLLCLARQKGYLVSHGCHGNPSEDNNHTARLVAQQLTEGDEGLEQLCELACQTGSSSMETVQVTAHREVPPSGDPGFTVVNTLIEHRRDTASIQTWLGSEYLLPRRSAFLMSDITCLQPLLQAGVKYDAVVLDPPWQNKSVKRKKKYHMLSDWDLLKLPVPALTKPGSLVLVWVTNRQQQHGFVTDTMFPAWNVRYLTRWFWLKVTKTGTPVYDLDSTWKKPYEVLILGRVCSPSETEDSHPVLNQVPENLKDSRVQDLENLKDSRVQDRENLKDSRVQEHELPQYSRVQDHEHCQDLRVQDHEHPQDSRVQDHEHCQDSKVQDHEHCQDSRVQDHEHCQDSRVQDHEHCQDSKVQDHEHLQDSGVWDRELQDSKSRCPLPEEQVIVSVPCSIHSRKPPLDVILKPYLPAEAKCLEMFARNLLPGWTSWGNQVLKFQQKKYFREVPA